MGRPSRFTAEAVDRFLKAIAAGSFPETAARFAGWSPATYYRFMQGRTPERAAFRDDVHQALVELEIRLVGTITTAAFREPRWALILLERRFGERWRVRPGGELLPDDDADRRQAPDDVVVLDPELVEVLVPKLLAAGDRIRSDAAPQADVRRFERRSPVRRTGDDGRSR